MKFWGCHCSLSPSRRLNLKNSITDIPDNVASKVGEELDDMIYKFTGL